MCMHGPSVHDNMENILCGPHGENFGDPGVEKRHLRGGGLIQMYKIMQGVDKVDGGHCIAWIIKL